ncbi:hypothetical protein RSOL_287950 [Rhizoctonia solani AG-3 Rhs1AP]|uniref:Uncharacterized protein n=1 Tax=Rhizoctonia solani AG-3 Rhs1AP TaxID=1086054 RepID=A0A0A1UKL5_9AGAM|nr:hypothetical protein RSOL_287950 [Rhizoctonia solani AG-3 Rhs1AP]
MKSQMEENNLLTNRNLEKLGKTLEEMDKRIEGRLETSRGSLISLLHRQKSSSMISRTSSTLTMPKPMLAQ